MNHGTDILFTLATVLGVAGAVSVLFLRLRLPVVFGYLVAGMIVGPYVPIPLVADEPIVRTLAEVGVVLVMFSIGLDFSMTRLAKIGPRAGIVGLVETSLMVWLGYEVGRLFGWTPVESFYAGAVVAISSTTIVAKVFGEQKVAGPLAGLVFGILVVEDLVAILLLAVLTAIASGSEVSPGALASTGGRLIGFLGLLLVGGMVVVPPLYRALSRHARPETTLVASVGLCFGAALLARSAGYSVALGAFFAGSLVAQARAGGEVERLVAPVRDIFGAIFFVSVGMLIDPRLVAANAVPVAVFSALVLVGKVVGVSLGSIATGYGIRTSVRAGLSLAQIGEFSFIIATLGIATGATRSFLFPVAVAVSAVTTLLTPFLVSGGGAVAERFDRRLPKALRTFDALYASWIERVHEGGPVDRTRRLVRRAALDVSVLAVLLVVASAVKVEVADAIVAATGASSSAARWVHLLLLALLAAPFLYGFARGVREIGRSMAEPSMPEAAVGALDHAAAPRRALVTAIQIAAFLLVGLPLLAAFQPFFPEWGGAVAVLLFSVVLAVVFWRGATNLDGHVRAVTEAIVLTLSDPSRGRTEGDASAELKRIQDLLPGLGTLAAVRVGPGDFAEGRTLVEVALEGRSGTTVLALLRDDENLGLDAAGPLRSGDTVALAGSKEGVETARAILRGGNRGDGSAD